MPIAHLLEYPTDGAERSTTNYDSVTKDVDAHANPPKGLLFHAAGHDEKSGVFRIFEVWETQEHAEAFHKDRVHPARQKLDNPREATRDEYYDLHNVIKGH